jgi:hypothetical protein
MGRIKMGNEGREDGLHVKYWEFFDEIKWEKKWE